MAYWHWMYEDRENEERFNFPAETITPEQMAKLYSLWWSGIA